MCIFLVNHADRVIILSVYCIAIANRNIVHNNCNVTLSLNVLVRNVQYVSTKQK